MDKATITPAERIAAMQERIDRLADRSALSGQIEACVKSRDDLADRLNRVIAVAEWRRVRVRELEKENDGLLSMLNAFLEQQNKESNER